MRRVALLGLVVVVSACGAAAKPKSAEHEAIPDVRGMNVNDAALRLLRARYCVRLEAGKPPSTDKRLRVQQQSPVAGSTRGAWSTVTLIVRGIPPGASTGVDIWGGGKAPCPEIRTTG